MLLDTSGLFAYHHKDESAHEEAKTLFRAESRKLTHSYVLSELVTLAYARGIPRASTVSFVTELLGHPEVETVWVDERLHRNAMALLLARPDKSYSLCDATSFVLMKETGMSDALTTDHHFEQEGFRRLL